MDLLFIDENILKKKNIILINNYEFNFLELLNDYSHIFIYYNLINTLEFYQLKNIWNFIVLKWNNMNRELYDDKKFIKSSYNNKYKFIHDNISFTKLNSLLSSFIDNDLVKSLFVINSLQNYFYK